MLRYPTYLTQHHHTNMQTEPLLPVCIYGLNTFINKLLVLQVLMTVYLNSYFFHHYMFHMMSSTGGCSLNALIQEQRKVMHMIYCNFCSYFPCLMSPSSLLLLQCSFNVITKIISSMLCRSQVFLLVKFSH